MDTGFTIDQSFIAQENERALPDLERDYSMLSAQLERRGIAIEAITKNVQKFAVAVPSWGVGTGGTRFARFAGEGEPRNVFDKLVDCAMIHRLTRATPRVALHIPWDKPEDPRVLRQFADSLHIGFDAMNSNTFQDQPGQALSYKFGSLTHADRSVRKLAINHNIECIKIGNELGSKSLSVWIGDGGNFPGQIDFRTSLERYLESAREIYASLPDDWQLFIEYKLYEPAFYSTVINDWGTAYYVAEQLGSKASCLVDLGHHAPNVNIEMIVARLLQFGRLGGFHFNDSKYGDDDLDAGSIKPFQLFLIFHELVQESLRSTRQSPPPTYMIDQSHNVTDPIESLINTVEELQRAYAQALLVNREELSFYQERNDAIMALKTLKRAFTTDVSPILGMARQRNDGAIDPLHVFRLSQYRKWKIAERPVATTTTTGIV
ncbi:MAG: L-rhamnose catabolism isomerase [Ignavibacteriae bacterium]|nr:L-rhamnose catabolism isomerase [Ignavibacteriota bacterium]